MKIQNTCIEPLEARIAPASVIIAPPPVDPDEIVYPSILDAKWRPATVGSPIELHAGEGLSTLGDKAGSYLLYIEKGNALVFTTDFNNNNRIDTNEITGIAAGNGLRMISFVDIHGDIVTNLRQRVVGDTTFLSLTDSDRNPSNDDPRLQGDGRVVLANTIEKVEFRALTIEDIPDQDNIGPDADGDGKIDSADETDLILRTPTWSSYSLFGSILAGAGFGAEDGGLLFNGPANPNYLATADAIYVGDAVSGKYFSFGSSSEYIAAGVRFGDDVNGVTTPFVPARGQAGASINTVKGSAPFNIGVIQAGNGGIGADGGSIRNIAMNNDDTGGYSLIAGDGGDGPAGGDGGSIFDFTDTGSTTGYVFVSSGSGGFGATGPGGNAGDGDFGAIDLRGDVHIVLGDGGTGFSSGGNGASLARARLTEPQGFITVDPLTGVETETFGQVRGTNGFGTTHYPDSKHPGDNGPYNARSIGTHLTLDFDQDGFGDFVYVTGADSTTGEEGSNSQLVVLLGAPQSDVNFPGYRTVTAPDGSQADGIYLHGARNPKALATGDVNGDGHPDIVTGSSDRGGSGDVMIFLSKFEDSNNDDILSDAEDLNGNGRNDFLGFWEPRHSTLPIVDSETMHIQDITVGDFDGDGRPEIVVAVSYNGVSRAVFLTADREFDPVSQQMEFTGQFFADFGTKAVSASVGGLNVSVAAVPYIPYYPSSVDSPYTDLDLEASPLNGANSTNDVLFFGEKGERTIEVIEWTAHGLFNSEPLQIGLYDMGQVIVPPSPAPVDYEHYDFTVADLNNDGIADLAGISVPYKGQYWYINWSIGEGFGDSVGIAVTGPRGYSLHTIRSMDADADGAPNEILLLHSPSNDTELSYGIFANGFNLQSISGLPLMGTVGPQGTGGFVDSRPIFVTYDQQSESLLDLKPFQEKFTATVTESDSTSQTRGSFYLDGERTEPLRALINFSLSVAAGSGGDSLQGRGGAGGFLGGKSSLANVVDPDTGAPVIDLATGRPLQSIVGAIDVQTTVHYTALGGDGGDGFSRGGTGGFVSGVVVRGGSGHELFAGDGGRGVTGAGGAGGSITSNSVESISVDELFGTVTPPTLIAGDGGIGRIGGAGGSVVGNGTAFYDILAPAVDVFAGAGGPGVRGGGNGGSITGLLTAIQRPDVPAPSYINFVAGKGGDTVVGKGGNGGGVINSSPASGTQLFGDINVQSGDGGKGFTGGNGGSIVNFVNQPDGSNIAFNPAFTSFLAGNGGRGTFGAGGNGGNINGLTTPTLGDTDSIPDFYRFVFSRAIAGVGGSSSSAKGGNGGDVSNVITNSQRGGWVFVGGAGGKGLHFGGTGGDLNNITVALGASTFSKALFIGGAGGDAGAFLPNSGDPAPNQTRNQFGGKIGKGGDGGSVTGITQTNAIATHIDLIAGDGGDSIHYGTPLDKGKTTYVGKGGSIRNVSLAGEAGNMDPAVGIKSYNNILAGETVADFVRDRLVKILGEPEILTDEVGNVGVVVGAAGRNKGIILDPIGAPTTYRSLSSRLGVNGSLENFTARNLMSAVAGNVDRLASIQVVKGLNIFQNIGVDKFGGDYLDQNLVPTVSHEPVLDGSSIDGGVIAKKYLNALGVTIAPPQNGYIR